jgi:hypothetical protein
MSVFSIKIQDFGMLFSDLIVAIACLFCYFNIKAKTNHIRTSKFQSYWSLFFLFESISFFIGGLAHGLVANINGLLSILSWYLSIFGVLYFTLGVMIASLPKMAKKYSRILVSCAIICAIITGVMNNFFVVITYCFIYMFIIIYINLKNKIISFKYARSKGILIGTLLFIVASIFFVLNIRLFSVQASVLSHIIIAIGIICFGNGCCRTILDEYQKSQTSLTENSNSKMFTDHAI